MSHTCTACHIMYVVHFTSTHFVHVDSLLFNYLWYCQPICTQPRMKFLVLLKYFWWPSLCFNFSVVDVNRLAITFWSSFPGLRRERNSFLLHQLSHTFDLTSHLVQACSLRKLQKNWCWWKCTFKMQTLQLQNSHTLAVADFKIDSIPLVY